jgi:hypothetical protein
MSRAVIPFSVFTIAKGESAGGAPMKRCTGVHVDGKFFSWEPAVSITVTPQAVPVPTAPSAPEPQPEPVVAPEESFAEEPTPAVSPDASVSPEVAEEESLESEHAVPLTAKSAETAATSTSLIEFAGTNAQTLSEAEFEERAVQAMRRLGVSEIGVLGTFLRSLAHQGQRDVVLQSLERLQMEHE